MGCEGDPSLITVVVCTHGRTDALRRCLASLAALDDAHHEVLVVDNNPAPGLSPLEAATFGARVVHEPVQGLDVARNRGAREASGGIVAFVDDDCEVHPRWLTALREPFADPAVSCVTGRVLAADLTRSSQRWFEDWFSFDRGPAARRFRVADDPRVVVSPGSPGTGCNMAFRRGVLARVGGFDEALDMGTPVGGGGDLDMFARVLSAGDTVAYEPRAVVFHHHRTTMWALRRQFFGYGAAAAAVYLKLSVVWPGRRRTVARRYRRRLERLWRGFRQPLPTGRRMPRQLLALDALGMALGPWLYLRSVARAQRNGRGTVGVRARHVLALACAAAARRPALAPRLPASPAALAVLPGDLRAAPDGRPPAQEAGAP